MASFGNIFSSNWAYKFKYCKRWRSFFNKSVTYFRLLKNMRKGFIEKNTNAKSMQEIPRITVRKHLSKYNNGTSIYPFVLELPLPTKVKRYMMLADIVELKFWWPRPRWTYLLSLNVNKLPVNPVVCKNRKYRNIIYVLLLWDAQLAPLPENPVAWTDILSLSAHVVGASEAFTFLMASLAQGEGWRCVFCCVLKR